MTLQKWTILIKGVYGENLCLFVGSSWNSVPGYIKTLTHIMKVSVRKKQVIKKFSPKSLWQTCMKWTVVSNRWILLLIVCIPIFHWKWFDELTQSFSDEIAKLRGINWHSSDPIWGNTRFSCYKWRWTFSECLHFWVPWSDWIFLKSL